MGAHHYFVEPYQPYTSHFSIAEALYIEETEAAKQREVVRFAKRIVDEGAKAVLRCNLSGFQEGMWERAARTYLDAIADGLEDEDGFEAMVDEFRDPPRDQTWALDEDWDWQDSSHAERRGMGYV